MFIKKYICIIITLNFGMVFADFPYPPALEIGTHYGEIPSYNIKEYPGRSHTFHPSSTSALRPPPPPPLSFASASESASGSASTSGSSSASASISDSSSGSAYGTASGSAVTSSGSSGSGSAGSLNSAKSHGDYTFKYAVHDKETSDIKRHHESRKGNVVKGSYELIQPDGIKRIVHYRADENGFNADVNYNHNTMVDHNSDSPSTNNHNNEHKSRKIRQIIFSRPIALTTSPRTPRYRTQK